MLKNYETNKILFESIISENNKNKEIETTKLCLLINKFPVLIKNLLTQFYKNRQYFNENNMMYIKKIVLTMIQNEISTEDLLQIFKKEQILEIFSIDKKELIKHSIEEILLKISEKEHGKDIKINKNTKIKSQNEINFLNWLNNNLSKTNDEIREEIIKNVEIEEHYSNEEIISLIKERTNYLNENAKIDELHLKILNIVINKSDKLLFLLIETFSYEILSEIYNNKTEFSKQSNKIQFQIKKYILYRYLMELEKGDKKKAVKKEIITLDIQTSVLLLIMKKNKIQNGNKMISEGYFGTQWVKRIIDLKLDYMVICEIMITLQEYSALLNLILFLSNNLDKKKY
jgi:hypothetical protein